MTTIPFFLAVTVRLRAAELFMQSAKEQTDFHYQMTALCCSSYMIASNYVLHIVLEPWAVGSVVISSAAFQEDISSVLQAALELVADLMEHSTSCMKEGLQHLTSLHFQQELFHESDFNIQANNITRSAQVPL